MFLYLFGKQHAKIVKTVRILISSTYQDMDIDVEYRNAVHLWFSPGVVLFLRFMMITLWVKRPELLSKFWFAKGCTKCLI